MVYKYGKGKKVFKKNKGKLPFSKKQLQVIKKITHSTNELKTFTPSLINDPSVVSGSTNSFTFSLGIPQGDGEGTRDGDQLMIKDYQMNLNINSGTTKGLVRVIVFENLGDSSLTLNSMTQVYSQYPTIQTSLGRYKVHMDKTYNINSSNVSSILIKKTFIPVIKKINYVSGSTTLVNGGGQLQGFVLTDNSVITQMTFDCQTRVRFYDS